MWGWAARGRAAGRGAVP